MPTTHPRSINSIALNIRFNKMVPAIAIAHEIAAVGIIQNETHQQNLDLLHSLFDSTEVNLDYFMLGFVTIPSLLISSHLFNQGRSQQAFRYLCPPTHDPILISHNLYKKDLFILSFNLFQASPFNNPNNAARPIYDLCRSTQFVEDPYFVMGISASEDLYVQYAHALGYP